MKAIGLLFDLDPCYPSALLVDIWIFVVLLGVDNEATCCLLRYNPEFIPALSILICSISICDYEMPENPTNICI